MYLHGGMLKVRKYFKVFWNYFLWVYIVNTMSRLKIIHCMIRFTNWKFPCTCHCMKFIYTGLHMMCGTFGCLVNLSWSKIETSPNLSAVSTYGSGKIILISSAILKEFWKFTYIKRKTWWSSQCYFIALVCLHCYQTYFLCYSSLL